MAKTPESDGVADNTITFRITGGMKREFEKALNSSEEFNGKMTPFFLAAIQAFVVQTKRKEEFSLPLEFVSDKSSDKV